MCTRASYSNDLMYCKHVSIRAESFAVLLERDQADVSAAEDRVKRALGYSRFENCAINGCTCLSEIQGFLVQALAFSHNRWYKLQPSRTSFKVSQYRQTTFVWVAIRLTPVSLNSIRWKSDETGERAERSNKTQQEDLAWVANASAHASIHSRFLGAFRTSREFQGRFFDICQVFTKTLLNSVKSSTSSLEASLYRLLFFMAMLISRASISEYGYKQLYSFSILMYTFHQIA